MKLTIFKGLLLLVVAFIGFGCPKKPEEIRTVDGNYVGSVKTGGVTSPMSMTTIQTGTQVAGKYVISAPLNESGTVSGNLIGLIYNFTLRRTLPTAATFSTSVDISDSADKLVGSYGNGLYTFELTRK